MDKMDYAKLKWNSNYPGKRILREEIKFMIEAFIEVLLKRNSGVRNRNDIF